MSIPRIVRAGFATGGLLTLGVLAACSETPAAPSLQMPSSAIQLLATVSTDWEFVSLIGTADGRQDWGISKIVANPGFGSIELLTNNSDTHVTTKGREDPVGSGERGVGICHFDAEVCEGDEIGDDHGTTSPLLMDFSGVDPLGTLTHIKLGSVQLDEGWIISYSTTGVNGPFTLLSSGFGDGSNNPGDVVDLTVNPGLGTLNLVLKFERNGAYDASGLNDFLVESVTIETAEDLGCTFTWGYWKTHDGSGPQANAWPVASLSLGSVSYNKAELQSILGAPVAGNGLISLAHQLIAAKLNIANGADPTAIAATITAADALIGSKVVPPVGSGYLKPNAVSALVTALDNFNSGVTGPGHCGAEVIF